METKQQAVLTITKNGFLEAIVFTHPDRHQVFFKVEEMGAEQIKDLLDSK